ncbi:MAG: hypothetical protein ACTJHY_12625 [Alcaligenes pakistanensis]
MILAGIWAKFFGVRGQQLDWRLFLKVFVVSAFISGAVASLFVNPIKATDHVAAWVQALGSIGAILMTGYIFHRERAFESKRVRMIEQRIRSEMTEQLRSLSDLAIKEMIRAYENKGHGGASAGLPFRSERLDQLREMVEKMAFIKYQPVLSGLALELSDKIHQMHLSHLNFLPAHTEICLSGMYRLIEEAKEIRDELESPDLLVFLPT